MVLPSLMSADALLVLGHNWEHLLGVSKMMTEVLSLGGWTEMRDEVEPSFALIGRR